MQNTQKLVLPVIVLGIVLTAFAFFFVSQNARIAVASAPMYDSYKATTTSSGDASATASYVACLGQCQLGSIVVSQVGTAGWVRVWDATSSATSTMVEPTPFSSSTYAVAVGRPIVQITGASDVAGTYVFDTETSYGVVVETSIGFDGQYQVMWRK
jgi:hypothetical protein